MYVLYGNTGYEEFMGGIQNQVSHDVKNLNISWPQGVKKIDFFLNQGIIFLDQNLNSSLKMEYKVPCKKNIKSFFFWL